MRRMSQHPPSPQDVAPGGAGAPAYSTNAVPPLPAPSPYGLSPSSLPQPMPPIPVQPVGYAMPDVSRPGLITAIGVISIIVGGLSLVASATQGLFTLVLYSVSQASARAALVAQQPAPTTPAYAEDGMADEAERRTVLTGLSRAHPVLPPRQRQLDALLKEGGKEIFLFRGTQLTPQAVHSNVTESGRLFDDDAQGPDFYVVGRGRIEVYDTHAVFYPDGGGETISASADAPGDAVQPPQDLDGDGIPGPAAAVPGVPASPIPPSNVYPSPGVSGAPPGAVSPVPPPLPAAAPPTVNPTAATLVALECGASFLLAVYLIIVGVITLRQSLLGRRLHLIYAWLKIPLAIAGGAAAAWMFTSLTQSAAAANPQAMPAPGIAAVWGTAAVIGVLVACIYPVALLIALSGKTARDYYDPAKAGKFV